ncbi:MULTISPECIES: DUF418 domain-containing protein [unclassified Wenzhouxiangella]|uniref:DUF418 domain-containing protein n=1 Tax=unclassified Wenzhouxiangella TaxID=2613841 RepID=UPI000E32AB62|nr:MULTISPECIES: DUF418 domain-containing protein [unclassified Wenzhouxiangella]RFF28255.1 DUF418 domain-containing protein [Wenzhouxiangella sp. 15181]RFP69387.1 DUF418 domain-containing protein [Wenzhouxiangella sp. 15190]
MTDLAPIASAERHEVLDALRGFALFGIFLANIRFFSGWEFLGADQRSALAGNAYELIDFLHLAVIDGKFYTLFSFLFGLGFALQLQRLEGRGAAASQIYLRRTSILLGFGLIHLFVFWVGDILTPYALLGFMLLAVRHWSDRILLIIAGLALLVPIVGYALFWAFDVDPSLGLYNLAYAMMPPGAQHPMVDLRLSDWSERLQSSFALGVLRFGYLFDTWRWPKLFAIMLLGLWAGRRLVRGELLGNTRLLVGVLVIGGLSGVIAGPILAALDGIGFDRPHSLNGLYAVIAYTFAVIPLGLAYAAGFVLLWGHASGGLRFLTAPGRMALTNYLGQTLIGLTVFYGIGLNQAGQWSVQALIAFACAVYLVQAVLSNFWLQTFQYGPMEWLWRTLTYGTAPKLRRAVAS